MNHLDIEAPMIAAVNGPALIHAELALLCDIVLASETAVFQDLPHFPSGLVPGDGVHVVFPLLLGANRGRYFLLMGEKIDAKEAKHLGLVGEVLPPDRLFTRAREVAHHLLQRPPLTVRYARQLLTRELKRLMLDNLAWDSRWRDWPPASFSSATKEIAARAMATHRTEAATACNLGCYFSRGLSLTGHNCEQRHSF
jgi:enoyl-CoA hydratase/carnithine racemase